MTTRKSLRSNRGMNPLGMSGTRPRPPRSDSSASSTTTVRCSQRPGEQVAGSVPRTGATAPSSPLRRGVRTEPPARRAAATACARRAATSAPPPRWSGRTAEEDPYHVAHEPHRQEHGDDRERRGGHRQADLIGGGKGRFARRDRPGRCAAAMFSTSTIASSTMMPMTSASASSVSVSRPNPASHMTTNVPSSDIGYGQRRDGGRRQLPQEREDHQHGEHHREPERRRVVALACSRMKSACGHRRDERHVRCVPSAAGAPSSRPPHHLQRVGARALHHLQCHALLAVEPHRVRAASCPRGSPERRETASGIDAERHHAQHARHRLGARAGRCRGPCP